MTADLARLEEIFTAAVAKTDRSERAAYLDEACGGDADLRQRLEDLLAADADSATFLPLPKEETTAIFTPVSERPGSVIGRYKLLEQIGEGGFGVVFMAEQEQPVRRRVALKIIKAGMDTRQVVARFEAERQALALMDYPNIARVFDGGATETGRPYFVMELVRGVPITEYCDEARLTTNERLALFQSVCSALQHAHQKGIIHRDLKPSNVLVTMHDDKAVPKVIDFGVAKATQGRLTDRTLFTEFRSMIGTPNYMSPEQAHMSGLDVDTRSDVYSLGVLLYELLTGTTPIDTKKIHQATYDDLRRLICEEEPPRPSARLSALSAERRTTLARQRHCEPAQLAVELRSELDWIVMKCLEKDRNRRYPTANALAADLQRYLANEPVEACPPARTYRLKKFVRRNKVGVLAGTAVVGALLFGIALATTGFVQAQRQAMRADTAAARTSTVSNFLQQMLQSADPDRGKGQDYTISQLLDDFSDGLSERFASQPEVEADVRRTVGLAYRRLDPEKSEMHLRRAMELRRQLVGEHHVEFADSLVDYSAAAVEQRRFRKAEGYLRSALTIYEEQGKLDRSPLRALSILQNVLSSEHRTGEVELVFDQALAIANKLPDPRVPEIANIYHGLIDVKIHERDYAVALTLARKCVELHKQLHGPNHPETGWGLVMLGNALAGNGDYDEAMDAFYQADALFRRTLPPADIAAGAMLDGVSYMLYLAGQTDRAHEIFEGTQKLQDLEAFLIDSLPEDLDLSRAGSYFVANAVESGLMMLIEIHSKLTTYYNELGDAKQAAEHTARIHVLEREIAAIRRKVTEQVSIQVPVLAEEILQSDSVGPLALCRCSWMLVADEQPAQRLGKLALALTTKAAKLSPDEGVSWNALGAALFRTNEWQRSVDAYRKSCELIGPEAPADMYFRAMAHWQLGQKGDARKWFSEAVKLRDRDEPHDAAHRRIHAEAAKLLGVSDTSSAPAPQP